MPLSDSKIRNLKPKDKSFKVSDFEGLYILVKPNGSKLWNFKYRLHGAEKKLSIGAYHLKLANTAFGRKPITEITCVLDLEVCRAARGRDRNGRR